MARSPQRRAARLLCQSCFCKDRIIVQVAIAAIANPIADFVPAVPVPAVPAVEDDPDDDVLLRQLPRQPITGEVAIASATAALAALQAAAL